MAISDTLNSIKTNLENAYTSLENKQATIPANKNIANLASAIDSIQQGGGEQGEFVYIKQVANDDGYTMYMDSTPNGGEKYKITYTETDDGLIDIALEGDESKLDLLYANTEIIVNGQTMELNEYDKSYGLDRIGFVSSGSNKFSVPIIDTSGVINAINGPLLTFGDLYLPNLLTTGFGFHNAPTLYGSSIDLPKCINIYFDRFAPTSSFTINASECISFSYYTYLTTSSINGTINLPKCESVYIGDGDRITISTLNMNSDIKWLYLINGSKFSYTTNNVLSFSQLEYLNTNVTGPLYSGVSLPNLKTVGSNAFISWNNLRTVSLPNLVSISDGNTTSFNIIFSNTKNLKEIYLPNFDMTYKYVTGIGGKYNIIMFSSLSYLEKVTLGSGTNYIYGSNFYNCSNLSFVDFQGAMISAINQDAFKNCYNLESINASFYYPYSSVNDRMIVGNSAFYNCYKLKEFYASNVLAISSNAFYNCSSLSTIQINAHPNFYMGSYAFENCMNLSIFIFKMNILSNTTIFTNLSNFDNTPIGNSALLGYYGSIYVENEYLDFMKYRFGSYSNRVTSLDNLPEGVTVRV